MNIINKVDYPFELGKNAQLAFDTLMMRPTKGIAQYYVHLMDRHEIEHFAGMPYGSYDKDIENVYLTSHKKTGTCFIDQYIPENSLIVNDCELADMMKNAPSTGAENFVRDGIVINSPEAVAEHLERVKFPENIAWAKSLDEPAVAKKTADEFIQAEFALQKKFGKDILKVPYDAFRIPGYRYTEYGYVNYFSAYALYEDVIERDFKLIADAAEKHNRILAKAIIDANLIPIIRLDCDMAGTRGTMTDIKSLDRIWFPHLERAIKPAIDAGFRLIWHSDGNLMEMYPRLLEVGISGFEGFQYEHGMDYPKICKMKDRDGNPVQIWAGVSVSKTLPFGTPEDVRRELKWLVDEGPKTGLILSVSSSVTPGTPRRNLEALFDGLEYYREHGRD